MGGVFRARTVRITFWQFASPLKVDLWISVKICGSCVTTPMMIVVFIALADLLHVWHASTFFCVWQSIFDHFMLCISLSPSKIAIELSPM